MQVTPLKYIACRFSGQSELCGHHRVKFGTCHPPSTLEKPHTRHWSLLTLTQPLAPSLRPPAPKSLLSISLDLPVPDVSDEWNHAVLMSSLLNVTRAQAKWHHPGARPAALLWFTEATGLDSRATVSGQRRSCTSSLQDQVNEPLWPQFPGL